MPATTGTVTGADFNAASGSFAHVVGSGVKKLLVAQSSFGSTDGTAVVTLDGVTGTLVDTHEHPSVANVALWSFDNPTAGSRTIGFSFASGRRSVIHAIDVTGTGTLSLGTAQKATASDTTPTVTVSAAGPDDLVLDVVGIRIGTSTVSLTVGADQTSLGNRERLGSSATNGHRGAVSTQDGVTSGDVMSWTRGTSDRWVIMALPIVDTIVAEPAPGAPESLTATPNGSGRIDLAWSTPADNVAEYLIRRSSVSYPATSADGTSVVGWTAAAGSTAYTYIDTASLTDGTRYYYSIFLRNSEDTEGPAGEVTAPALNNLEVVNPLGTAETPDVETANVPLEFTAPAGAIEASRVGHFRLQVDGTETAGIVDVWTAADADGWEYDIGGGYVALTTAGIDAADLPAEVRYTPTAVDSVGRYTWRVRVEHKAGE